MFQANQSSQLLIRRVALVAIAVIVAISAALTIAIVFLDLDNGDASALAQLLFSSAVISLGIGGAFIWISSGRGWNHLITRLLAAQGVGMIVIAINIAIAAYAMFISTHDLSLLTLLLGLLDHDRRDLLIPGQCFDQRFRQDALAAARRMSSGDLSVRVPIAPERELAELGVAFNTMAAQLEAAFRRQRELEDARQGLIAAVSHDLRTPLASLRVMVEAINDGVANDPETVQRYIKAMERETVSLGRLIDDLFEMARLDAGQIQLRLQPNPIGIIVQEALESLGGQAARQGIALRSNVDRAVPPVLVDPDRIQRVLYNLIQNAIRHTPADGSVIIEAFDRGPDVQVNVRDTGEGIPADDLPHVFDRFYRGDKARSRDEAAGAGLGLTIARRLVETHGGRIWVAQPPEGGSVFSFTLPKVPIPR